MVEHVAAPRTGDRFGREREVVAIGVGVRRDVLRVGFDQTGAVTDHLLTVETNAVAGQADHTFDVSLADIFRVEEGHDVAAFDLAIRQDAAPTDPGWA